MYLLAGDIGGTKTLLQLSQAGNNGLEVCFEKRFVSADFSQFEPMLEDFLNQAVAQGATPEAACFGVAGPVNGRTARTTNLPWFLDADRLETEFGIPRLRLINDFQSIGYGIEALTQNDLVTLQTGTAVEHGTRVIIGAGTGLGHGLLVWQQDHYEVVASEGGHASFAPTDELQTELLQYLRKHLNHVSWESVVSGPGLVNIFEFMQQASKTRESAALYQARHNEDPAAAISRFALSGEDPLAVKTLDLFVSLYGAQAGNLALTGLASGGVYVAGGITPKIISKLKDGSFMSAFVDKDVSMQDLLKAMPVRVVMNTRVGLLGSALAAARLASQ